MARRPTTPCSRCGKLLYDGKGALPAGERTCRDCRRQQSRPYGLRKGYTYKPGSASARGYGSEHRNRRRQLLPLAIGTPCPICGVVMLAGDRLDLDHTVPLFINPHSVGDRIVHASCNRRRKRGGGPRGGTTERGYGWEHQKRRAKWKPYVERGEVTCVRCGYLIQPGQRWHLDHNDHDRALYNGPAHARCNLEAAGRQASKALQSVAEAVRNQPSRVW